MDRILKTLTLVPDEYFRNRNNMDESIYVYLDRNQFIIDAKGKIFRNKRTDKQITIEIADNEICRTKKETLEKFQKKIEQQRRFVLEASRHRERHSK